MASLALWVAGSALIGLALLGALGARAGGAPVGRSVTRVVFWGALAMAITAGVGRLFGVALDQTKQTDRAVATFETCLEKDPEFADALNYLAYLWAVRGERLDEALRFAA